MGVVLALKRWHRIRRLLATFSVTRHPSLHLRSLANDLGSDQTLGAEVLDNPGEVAPIERFAGSSDLEEGVRVGLQTAPRRAHRSEEEFSRFRIAARDRRSESFAVRKGRERRVRFGLVPVGDGAVL